ncbi:hypothetical protein GFGA_2c0095 (plasmid) [Gluconobacter frateurii NBRC 103465]|nr:hypothetical protein GFGA_2c0095 [Gluconobacter frateurii NBRC 103465]
MRPSNAIGLTRETGRVVVGMSTTGGPCMPGPRPKSGPSSSAGA